MPPKRQERDPSSPQIDPIDVPQFQKPLPIIKVVGISGSGKSTLVRGLRSAGYDARPVSQEHSNVPTLWQQFDRPAYLIYLGASLENQETRRQDVTWSAAAHQEEARKLAHAREHADVRIDTGKFSPTEVLQVALAFLQRQRVRHAASALEPLPATGSATKRTPPNSAT